MCLTGNLYQSNYNRVTVIYGYTRSSLPESRHYHVLDTEKWCLNALVFTVLKRTLIFFEEHTKEKVSALKSEQSTTVLGTDGGKNFRKSLGKVKVRSHKNMNSIGR